MWLSDLTESNDREEMTRTFNNIWEAVKKRLLNSDLDCDILEKEIEIIDQQYQIEVQVDKPYGICFCKKYDDLQQWNEYGDKTRGVVLGFDLGWFQGLEKCMPHPSIVFSDSIGYENILYHNKQLEEGFYRICYDLIKEHGLSAWLMGIRSTFKYYSAFVKNPTFEGECESRIVYYPNHHVLVPDNVLGIRGPENEPFIHYCLPWTRGDGDNALKAIGLGCNCSLTQDDLRLILTNAGLIGEFQLFRSEGSYRLR
jgi:hypothetical protein